MGNRHTAAGKRTGVVSVVDGKTAMVRVRFDDIADANGEPVVSHWIQVAHRRVFGDREYWMPDVGEQVLIDFDVRGIETAYSLGGVYSTEDPPPVTDPNKHHVQYKDGTFREYDRKQHLLTIKISGEDLKDEEGEGDGASPRDGSGGDGGGKGGKVDIFIEETTDVYSKGKITIKTDADVLVQAEGKVDVIAKKDVTVKTDANATVEAQGDVSVKCRNYKVEASGDIEMTAGGSMKLDASFIDIG